MGMMGYSHLIALPHKERPVNDLFNKQRTARGRCSAQSSVHRCLSVVSNKAVAVLADRDFTNNGEIINFLGRDVDPEGRGDFCLKPGP